MPGERMLRILAEVAGRSTDLTPRRLCEVCADVAGMSGAGIMLMTGDEQQATVCSSDRVSALIEELQYTLGEGPCVDAHRENEPVLEPDLASPTRARWPAFTPRAVSAGARAVFGFPLVVDLVRLGSLNLYRDRPGPMSDDQYADSVVLAAVAAQAVLAMQANARPGDLAAELEEGANLRLVVHQAAGMVAAQLDLSVNDALARLRAYAFASDSEITDVARAVVARELRFSQADRAGESPA